MLNIGLDVHLQSSTLCILDADGRVAERLRQIEEPVCPKM